MTDLSQAEPQDQAQVPAAPQPHGKPFTGWHMLTIIVLFFGVVISVNMFMVSSALRSWTGLVVENSYVASQQFNEKLLASRTQAALNWTVDLHYEDGYLKFSLEDAVGRVIHPDEVVVELTRPVGIDQDMSLTLIRAVDVYVAEGVVPTGVWNALITATIADAAPFEYRARLIVEH